MKLHEYQAKQHISLFGIPIPSGRIASTPDEVYDIAVDLNSPVLLKPQVLGDSREAAGGIQYASNPEDARQRSADLFTNPTQGQPVDKVLVEAAYNIVTSIYVRIMQHPRANSPVMIAALLDGDVQLALDHQLIDHVASEIIHPFLGLHSYQARNLASAINLPYEYWSAFSEITTNLATCYLASDALIVEINPLMITSEHQFIALDCAIHLDDSALFRQSELAASVPPGVASPGTNARQIQPIYFDGQIGCVANGLGLGMAAMDLVQRYGSSMIQPGCIIDIGGEASESRLEEALQTIHSVPQVRVLLMNIFAVVAPCDQTARILLRLLDKSPQLLTIIRLAGINTEEGIQIINDAKLQHVIAFNHLTQAARTAVDVAKNGAVWQF